MTSFSFLDFVPIVEGGSLRSALANAADIAVHCDDLGYRRYWAAEHHGMPGIGSAATSVVLAHAGHRTRRIRIGAGGVMLPNHAPLQIAEQFGTLDALFPGRVDLGLGRAPGSDQRVARAMRRTLLGDDDAFPRDVVELLAYFRGDPDLGFVATPGAGAKVEAWILGSSTFGAQLAAALGLPYGFASHFAPALMDRAIELYRTHFRPSEYLAKPYVMVGYNVYAADSEDEASLLYSSAQQSYVALVTGDPRPLLPPRPDYDRDMPEQIRTMMDNLRDVTAIGTIAQVTAGVNALIRRTGADEVIIAGQIHDHAARKRSIALTADAFAALPAYG